MLRDHLKKKKWEAEVPLEWIDLKLAKGHCIILLDGLDEVADSTLRHRIVDWVQNQMVTYGKNRFLITSRPFGYRDYPLNGATVLEVQPFSKEKIKEFVHSWYIANEMRSAQRGKDDPAVRLRAGTGAEDLLQRMRSKPVLFDLAVNPLLLTMIATVHRDRNSLPGKRVDLYAEICEVFLGKRQEVRGLRLELTPAQTQKVLQPLAFDMMSKGKRDISLADAQKAIADSLSQVSPIIQPRYFLKLVENSSGLLLERERELYTFAHLTFQEYLASVHIKEEKFEHLLVAQIDMSWWHETIRLYCAQADASVIMMACIESQYPSIPALMLALECPQEALMVRASVRHQLEIFINQSIENGDAKRRSLIAETFLTQRIYEMPSLEKETYIDRSLITCAEYQLFLDDQQKNGIYCAPDHWDSNFFSENQGRMPVLGVRISDAKMFCQWLTQRSLGIWQYRLPTTDDLEEFPESGSINSNVGNKTIYWISNGEKFTGEKDFLSTLEVRQRYFAPESLRSIIPLLKLVLALPRECARTFSAEKASNFVATLKPVIKLALSIAHESGIPDWIISYYSSLSPEGLDLPPNPSRAFNKLIDFLEKAINPRPYLVSFLDAVDRYIQRNGLTLDPNLDRTLVDKSAPIFKIIQIAEGISNIATQNLDKIEDTLIGIDTYIRTPYYPKAENKDEKANDPVRNEEAVYPTHAWTARGVFMDIQKDFHTINFPMLETQIINLGSHLMANHDSPAFGLDSSLTEISKVISRFDLEALLNIDPIITISQALLDTLDLSLQRRFNSLYVPEGILPDGSLLVFLHLLLRFLTIRLVEYLQELQKNIEILHESSILPYPGNGYNKVKKDLNAAINQCISIYVTSTLIGERYLNHLPAYEGILIVKEPKMEI